LEESSTGWLSSSPGENEMDAKTVRRLEEELEKPIADVIRRLGRKELPLKPSRHTIEMMAKAAVAVYEAVVEEREGRE
jgi:hypothetical protein